MIVPARRLLFGLSFLVVGCAPEPVVPATVVVPPSPPQAPTPAVDEGPPVVLHMDAAPAFEAASTLESLSGQPVLIDVAVVSSLRCAVVTVDAADRLPRHVAAERLAAALRSQHVRVEHAVGQWVISADASSPPAACAPTAPPAPVVAQVPDDTPPEVVQSIRRVSNAEYVFPRHSVDLLLEHATGLLRQMRLVPERQGDKVVGLRLFGVRSDGVLAHLGIENGDRLERISGHDVTTPDSALAAYASLRQSKRVVVELNRRGAPVKIVVRLE